MWKFVVRSGATRGSNTTEERHINVKKDIVAPIINDLLCNVVKANTATKVPSTKIVLKYNSNWDKTWAYSWVTHKDGRMFCKVCSAANKDNRLTCFAKEGAGIPTALYFSCGF